MKTPIITMRILIQILQLMPFQLPLRTVLIPETTQIIQTMVPVTILITAKIQTMAMTLAIIQAMTLAIIQVMTVETTEMAMTAEAPKTIL